MYRVVVDTLDLPPEMLFVLFVSLVAVLAVVTALLMIDKQAEQNIMLTQRIESLERSNVELINDLHEWRGFPRKLLEADLQKGGDNG